MTTHNSQTFSNILETEVQNRLLMDSTVDFIKRQFPVKGKKHTLELIELSADDTKTDEMDFPAQKEIKLKGKTWATPIYGHLRLRDNETGKIIDETKKTRIASLPRLTNRYSMIIDGSEYQTINQLRLKSGIYTREKENGELESWFDLEKGYNFKMIFDPTNKLFYLTLANRKFKLFPILKALGFPEERMRTAWGREIFEENKRLGLNKDIKEIPDLVEKLTKVRPKNYDEAVKELASYLDATKVNPNTTKITLGESFDKVNADTLFATSKKVLGVLRGEREADERDSLVFKNLFTPPDLLSAYMEKQEKVIGGNLLARADNKDSIKDIISSDTFSKPIKRFYTVEDLSSTTEQTNPVNILNEWRKTTVMGTGGVQSDHAITMSVRDVHPSHMGFLDPLGTPESSRVGVTLPLAVDISKDKDEIQKKVVFSDGTRKNINPTELATKVVAFPDQWKWQDGKPKAKMSKVKAMADGEVKFVAPSRVEVWMESPWSLFSWQTNLVPFMQNNDAVRASFGSKMGAQALALDKKESALVETNIAGIEKEQSFQKTIGRFLSPGVPNDIKAGTVTKITDDYIYIKPDGAKTSEKVGLFKDFPLNRETFIDSTPTVKVGDRVKAGQELAITNYQDPKDGSLALGLNVNVAYMPWKGLNYEDSAVITESLAKEFSSSKITSNTIITHKEGTLNLSKFRTYFPTIMTDEQAKKYDEEGVIKVGETVEPEDLLVAYFEPKDFSDTDKILRSMNKSVYVPVTNRSLTWDGHSVGKVVYVNKLSGGKIVIHVKHSSPMVVGDKIAGRHGNKSIVSRIIPDDEAPHTQDGQRIDLIMSPNGVPGRMNVGQLLETAAGKIAKKTGKKFIVDNFSGENYLEKIKQELKDNGLEADEVLRDGKNGKPFINKIFTGNQYIMKMKHVVDDKIKGRSYGTYSVNEQPSRGDEGGQTIDPLTTFALLSHGAKENMKEFAGIKSQRNDEIWSAIQTGRPIPPPQTNFAFEKLLNYLEGTGVKVNKKGHMLEMEPMTDEQILERSGGELTDAGHLLVGKNLSVISGGLYDKDITGGMKGKKWSHITLSDKMPHPLHEKAILSVLKLTKPQYHNIIAEKAELPQNGETGVKAIEKALRDINVDAEINTTRSELAKAPRAEVNKYNKRVRYLQALKKFDKNPADVYMIKHFPIMPPIYRPTFALASGDLNPSPINYNYKDLALVNDGTKKDKAAGLDEIEGGRNRLALYKEMAYTIGTEQDMNPKNKRVKEGILLGIAGQGGPKKGYAHSKLWSKRQDLSGRSTITLEPQFGLDEIGLPEGIYKKVFLPFAVQELVRQGYSPIKAREEINNDTAVAQTAFNLVMKDRPVIMNRAPSLHKHSVQAHMAKPVKGSSIKLNPLIVKGYNADFDGDTMSVHVPISNKAVEEAFTMLPSKNIWQPGNKGNIPAGAFAKDYMLGLWQLTKERQATNYRVSSIAEAYKLHKEGKIEMNDTFYLKGQKTSLGRQLVIKTLPKAMQPNYDKEIRKKELGEMLDILGKQYPADFVTIIDALKDLALQFGHEFGSSISITDLDIDRSYRDQIVNHFKKVEKPNWSNEQKARHWLKAQQLVEEAQNEYVKKTGKARGFFDMLDSGAEGKQDSVRQLISMPGVKIDVYGKPVPVPIDKSYAEGLDQGAYWTSFYGARKGMVDRAINTEQSGAINKALLGVTKGLLITEHDCKTKDGVEIEIDDTKNLYDRFLSKTIVGVGQAGQEVDNIVLTNARKKGLRSLLVRSPLTCETIEGICQKCYGIGENGSLEPIGSNVGVKSGQTATERSTQLIMKCTINSFTVNEKGEFVTLDSCYSQKHRPSVGMVSVHMEDGGVMIVQENHPMWVNGGQEKEAKDLIPGKDKIESALPFLLELYEQTPKNDLDCDKQLTKKYGEWNTSIEKNLARFSKEKLSRFLYLRLNSEEGVPFSTGFKITSRNFVYIDQLRVICAILGIRTRIYVDPMQPGTEPRYSIHIKDSYALRSLILSGDKHRRPAIYKKWTEPKTSPKEGDYKEFPQFITVKKVRKFRCRVKMVYDRVTKDSKFITGTYINHNSFHSGGSAAAEQDIVAGFPRFEQILKVPEIVAGKATLASVRGQVNRIQKSAIGGVDVFISGVKHHVPHGRKLLVKRGDNVMEGDAISSGAIKPQELSTYKGYQEARLQMVKDLENVFKKESIGKKTFETVIRGVANQAIIEETPENSSYIRGDVAPLTKLKADNKERVAKGMQPIKYQPYFKSIDTLALDNPDWLSKLTVNRIRETLKDGASFGAASNLHGTDPMPSYLYGTEFGKGKFY